MDLEELSAGMYFDRLGDPISMEKWCELMKDIPYRVIAKTKIGTHEISTVWLGVNHNFISTGKPIIFETMVFPECEDMDRYHTEKEAIAGHERMVKKWRKRLKSVSADAEKP